MTFKYTVRLLDDKGRELAKDKGEVKSTREMLDNCDSETTDIIRTSKGMIKLKKLEFTFEDS